MPNSTGESHLTRLVNLDWLIERNAIFLAMANTKSALEDPEVIVDATESTRHAELLRFQSHLMLERNLLRAALVGSPPPETIQMPASPSLVERESQGDAP